MRQPQDTSSREKARERLGSSSSHVSLTDRAHRMLRGAILCGEIEEGTFLTEARAHDKFKIGHTPFREACNRLLHEGFLELMPRRGYFVPRMTLSKVRDFFEARIIIESQAAELAAFRASKDQVKKMAGLLKEQLPSRLNATTVEVIVRANSEFHLCLAEMTQNEEIVRVVDNVLDRSARLVYLSKSDEPNFDVHSLHRPVFEAIRRRNGRLARKMLLLDLQSGQEGLFGAA